MSPAPERPRVPTGDDEPSIRPAEPGRLLGRSPPMMALYERLGRVAGTDLSVLVLGAPGTGKELVARTLHEQSARAGGPFVAVNCAAVTRARLEGELFGHEPTRASGRRRRGQLELADGGTLFLDEIGELVPALQARLLTVLRDRVLTRAGSAAPLAVDVRIVASTHRDLPRLVTESTFNEDLFHHLDGARLALPPLRERPGDVRLLARAFAARWAPELAGGPVVVTEGACTLLEGYTWPGNVRELENVVKRALPGSASGRLEADALRRVLGPLGQPELLPSAASLESLVEARLRSFLAEVGGELPEGLHREIMDRVERSLVRLVLEHAQGNRLEAARVLGMNRNTLARRIRELGVEVPARRRNRRHG